MVCLTIPKITKYKFYKICFKCKGTDHFSYLCFKDKNKNLVKATSKSKIDNISANNINLEVKPASNAQIVDLEVSSLNISTWKKQLLPTFTIKNYLSHNEIDYSRVLYDSASEYSFISLSLAKRLKYKVVQPNICLSINGINENKKYQTNIIEFNIMVGNKETKFRWSSGEDFDLRFGWTRFESR